jgi:hypothetical protein
MDREGPATHPETRSRIAYALVREPFRAEAERREAPLVRTAFRAAAERSEAVRRDAARLA